MDSVIRIMPLFCTKETRERFIAESEQELAKHKNSELYLHIFSNNGCWALSYLLDISTFPIPRKVIFDSAPLLFPLEPVSLLDTAFQFSTAITGLILRKEQYYSFPLTHLVAVFLAIAEATIGIFPPNSRLNSDFLKRIPRVPLLFMYSTGDKLIKADRISRAIGDLRSLGYVAREKVFGAQVPHVRAMRLEAAQYFAELDAFL